MANTANRNRIHQSGSSLSGVPRSWVEEPDAITDVRELPSTDRNVMRTYMQEIGKTPLLTKEEEIQLAPHSEG